MKVFNLYIMAVATVLLTLVGCTKKQIDQTPGAEIMLTATEAGATKALLDNGTFAAIGNRLKIYDYFTPGDSGSPEEGYYIDDIAQSGGAYTWPFVNNKYQWTSDGVHKFFGWLIEDVNETELFTPTFDKPSKTLTIPETTLGPNTAQYDFMYSNIHVRNLNTNPDLSAVPLEFSHLFTAFSIAAKDVAEFNDYILDYIELEGVSVTNSATINYNGDEPAVTYGGGEPVEGDPYRITFTDGLVLTTNYVDLSNRQDLSAVASTRQYMLSWPRAARAVKINIGYRAKEINDLVYSSYTKSITLTNPLVAGQKNNINLDFKDKEITLNYLVEPWTVDSEEIDFSDQVTVDEEGTITWDLSTVRNVDYTTGRVLLFDDDDIEATCTFTILTPKGATWTASLISKEGHPDAFRFVEGTKYGTVGGESTIKLVVTNLDPKSPRHVCELLITVQTADGRTIVVDDALTPEVDEEGNETTYSRFQIIQNVIN